MVTYKITAQDTPVTGLIMLIAVYFTYYLEYKKDVFLALTFLQEKLTNTPVSIAPKTHYNNLFCSVTLFEEKVPSAELSETKIKVNIVTVTHRTPQVYVYPRYIA